jgi:hypothetical protein
MIAGLNLPDHGGRHGGHAARRGPGRFGPFEGGDALFESIDGRVGVTAVAVAGLLVQETLSAVS